MHVTCVHQLFELQAALTPERPALIDATSRLTYRELEQRANQVAQRLRALGAGPDALVALYTRRSVAMIGMLGILKAEAAYVPIDPSYPPLRIQQILQSAQPVILLTESSMPDLESSGALSANTRIVYIEDESAVAPVTPPVDRDNRADSLAYVMYTSGSTGRPKGVAMQHDSLMNMLQWHRRVRPASPGKRTLQFCAIGFDFSFHEIFSTLCFGGSLVLAPDAVRGNPVDLLHFICQHDLERLFLPVSVLRQLAEAAGSGAVPPHLSEVITTGERLRIDPAMTQFFRRTGAALHNHYGATEFQDALTFTLQGDAADWPELPPAGHPIDNVRTFILDAEYQQTPPGASGELYIAGAGLARGYYGQPDLTAERYGVHAVRTPDGQPAEQVRLYRTGDIARLRGDGAVEILGRADDQLKINGVRVEPAEIEVVLATHPAVKAVAVVPREDLPGQQRLVAYFVSDAEVKTELEHGLREFLVPRLPAQLIPSEYRWIAELPLTSSGKLNRRALSQPPAHVRPAPAPSPRAVEQQLVTLWRELLENQHLGVNDNFFEAGGSSLLAVRLHAELYSRFGAAIMTTTVFQHPTIARLTAYLTAAAPAEIPAPVAPAAAVPSTVRDSDIAVIGMSCRFPGADSSEQFWQNLCNGVESLTHFTDEELEQHDAALRDHPDYVKVGFVLTDVAGFDEEFFGYSARDAATIDPQQRVLLECAWEAFENAGYAPGRALGSVGVFVGSSLSTYLINHIASELGYGAAHPFIEADLQQFQLKMGNDRNYLATRISYKLDLTGPSVNVQTACSTALVAIHLARRSILSGECELALAGGISLTVPQKGGYLYQEGMVRSPDGHCRAFDAEARGTLLGNGGGVVLLKRLAAAVRDGDHIVAVISGSAALNDGGLKAGYAAPSVEGQAVTVAAAIREAGIDSARIAYVEAHGTATALGDPVEVAGLTQAFHQTSQELQAARCALGSAKTNIGHLDEAAGIAGFIKAALVAERGLIPPSLNFHRPNPRIDFSAGPFYVNTVLSQLPPTEQPRYVGVSAMGVGGTNCHVVLREPPALRSLSAAPAADNAASAPSSRVLVLSARSLTALRALAGSYAQHLQDHPELQLADVVHTANCGRKHFAHRLAVRAQSTAELQEQLSAFSRAAEASQPETATAGCYVGKTSDTQTPLRVAFLFSGLGTAYVNMGRELYATQPVFRQQLDRCEELLHATGLLALRLTAVLFPSPGAASPLGEIEYAQPILFAFEYALACLLQSWGLRPDLVVGHSAGEYAAACIAGVFTLEDGIRLTALRGQMMRRLPNDGAMLEVPVSEAEARQWCARYDELYIGVINGPSSVVISGRRSQVDTLERELVARDVRARRLEVPGAGHTPFQDPMAAAFAAAIHDIRFSPASAAPILLSNLTGHRADEIDERFPRIVEPRYWGDHSRCAVQFAANMQALDREDIGIVIEVGPRSVLIGLGRRCLPEHAGLWLPTLQPVRNAAPANKRPALDEPAQLMACLGRLHVHGAAIDWSRVHAAERAFRIPLPTYPWQRKRHWFAAPRRATPGIESKTSAVHPLLGREVELAGSEEVRFQSRVGLSWPRWMKDHRAFGALVMPGVAYIEMALAAGAELLRGNTLVIKELVIQQSMVLAEGEDETALQQVLRPDGNDGYNFQIYSAPCPAGRRPQDWTLHVTGKLGSQRVARGQHEAPPYDMPALRAAHPVQVSLQQLRQQEEAVGVNLGETFWIFEEIWLDPRRHSGFGRVRLTNSSAETTRELKQYKIHPAYLEACLLALTATYPDRLRGKGYAPFFIDTLQFAADLEFYTGPETELWYHVRLRDVGDRDDIPPFLTGDCTILTAQGVPIVDISGFQLTAGGAQSMLRTASVPYHDWLYETRWKELEHPAQESQVAPGRAGRWLVFAGDEQLTAQLWDAIRQRGEVCTLVRAGERFAQQDESCYVIAPLNPEHYRQLLAQRTGAADIVFVQSGESGNSEVLDTQDLSRLLHLAQALLGVPPPADLRTLWLVTRGAYAGVVPNQTSAYGTRVAAPLGAALAALGKVIAREHPELRCAQLDVDTTDTSEDRGAALLAYILRTQSQQQQFEERVALRGGTWFCERLVRYTGKAVLSPDRRISLTKSVSPSRSYLITGGLGGLGLLVAQWLAERGAQHIILVGRSAANAQAQETIRTLQESLTQLLIIQADVSKLQEVTLLLDQVQASAPPLAGVVHAAGVAKDAWFRDLTEEQLQTVGAPKIDGAWNLHRATAALELDWFVMFSSASALLGNAGQAGYAAANAFMDALAAHRRSVGLPALSINWGTWSGVGLAAALDLDLWSRQSGEGYLAPPQGLRVLERLLAAAGAGAELPAAVAVMPIRWPEFLAKRSAPSPFFAAFREAAAMRPADPQAISELEIAAAPATARRAKLIAYVQQRVAQLLGLTDPRQVPVDTRLVDMGLDSLMIVELRNHLQVSLKCSLAFAFLFSFPNVEALADQLHTQLFPSEVAAGSGAAAPDPAAAGALSTVVRIQPLGTAPPLFFVSGVLGSVLDQFPLAQALGNQQPLFALRSFGLDEDAAPYHDLREIAAHHVRSLRAVQPSGPYQVGGHSFGGIVAFEIARQLVMHKEQVALLALVDSAGPEGDAAPPPGPEPDLQIISEFLAVIAGATGLDLQLTADMLQGLEGEAQVVRIYEALRASKYVASLADARRLLSVHRANHLALASYRVEETLPIAAVLLRAQARAGHPEIWSSVTDDADGTAGWSRVLTGALTLESVPGDHFTAMRPPGVGVIAAKLAERLLRGREQT